MSLLVPLALAAASAVAYGCATAVEHSAAHASAPTVGSPDAGSRASSLLSLLRKPRWLLGMAGDGLGLVLQVLALATGPVLLVQPILVLALPVSLPVARLLGGPRVRARDYRACAWILGGLALFFVLVGDPGPAGGLTVRQVLVSAAIVVAAGVAALAAAELALRGDGRARAGRAAIMGAVAGAWFGYVAVLVDAVATAWDDAGLEALTQARALAPLIVLVIVGAASVTLTQAAFQIGSLGASFPANLVADPVLAIVLGAVLLKEDLPLSAGHIAAYAVCLATITYGAVRLAADRIAEPAQDFPRPAAA
jgi:hypothetical protein